MGVGVKLGSGTSLLKWPAKENHIDRLSSRLAGSTGQFWPLTRENNMVITFPTGTRPFTGPRPINPGKDVSQVVNLLELVFGHRLDGGGQRLENGGQRLFGNETGLTQPAFLWRLNPLANKMTLGYVWEENGRIVGNATLLTTRIPGRYLVVNVAVHPDYRRRGIAHDLMESLTSLVQSRGGHKILLQVVKGNTPAASPPGTALPYDCAN